MSRSPPPPPVPNDLRAASQRPWQRRSSPLARYALLAYLLIVVDASLYPFRGWRDLGLAPYDFLAAEWPPHALPFDLLVNAIGYLPLGFVAGLALHPRVRGLAAVVVATLLCTVLSIHLEALQTYLPSRVASKVDVLANVAGGVVGAVLAARFAHALLDTGRLRAWRTRWFAADASRGLVLVLVWFAALVYPEAFVFGTGDLLKAFDPQVSNLLAGAWGLTDQNDPVETATRFQLAESTVAALMLLATGLLFQNLVRAGLAWPKRVLLVGLFIVATVTVAAFARAFLFEAVDVWPVLSPGARTGVAFAASALLVATILPSRVRWAGALLALMGALTIVNVYPDNPYSSAVGLAWTRGKLLNFYGLASGLNLVWPYLALVYLVRHRGAPTSRGQARATSGGRAPRTRSSSAASL